MNPTDTPTTPVATWGGATVAQLRELYSITIRGVLKELKEPRRGNRPGTDMLGIARSILKDSGELSRVLSPEEQADIQKMYRLYMEHLLQSLESGGAPTSIITEVGHVLRSTGFDPEASTRVTAKDALEALADLPFPTEH